MSRGSAAAAGKVRNRLARFFTGFLSLAAVALAPSLATAAEVILNRGDAAVTGFSGSITDANVPKDVHPLDVTFIDTDGTSLQVFDLSKLGGGPNGQLANAPVKLKIKAGEIGQVFAVTLDSTTATQPANIYVAATSLFGLQIVEEGKGGKLVRLVKGAPGAKWMPGQFGLDKGGGPGSVWKIDATTGAVSHFSTITSGNVENAGPGLGGLAFDPVSKQLFVTSLETGLIHRLDISGRELDTFDHGTSGRTKAGLDAVADDASKRMDISSPKFSIEDPATWGYADAKRRVVAVAVDSGRLYYSVAEGPVIWSVGLNSDGSFADDARLEVDVTGTPNGNMITGIAFDGPGQLYLTQRGETAGSYDYSTFARPQSSVVWRYTWDASNKSWKEAPEEFAISLEPPHRSTNGGLAFNYGYDQNGNIDYGKCRETLWTTGEHLRNGPNTEDPRTVHGLQGNYKTLAKAASITRPRSGSTALQGDFGSIVESNLDAPKETWFTDNDGKFEDDKAHGFSGAVAIYTPCDKQEAAAPRPEAPAIPAVPSRRAPGIFISKDCFPGAFGGVIQCRITVTNTGVTPSAPVSFTDASTILFGPGVGGALPIQSFTPDAPGWFCTPTPTTAFQCVLPAGVLLPGTSRFVDVFINTGPLTAAGNAGFRNCATSQAPFKDAACVEAGNGTTGLVISKTGPAQCNPGTPCLFALTVKNTGGLPFAGNVQISDAMFVGGASVAAPITSTTLNCAGGNPPALPFTCVVPLTLAPGASQTYSMTVTMPAAPPNYWAQNCFATFDPAFVPPGGPLPSPGGPGGVGFGSPTNPACAWVAAGNPPPQSNLRVTKTPIGGTCASSIGTGIASCQYQIRVSNDGPTPFNNFVTINEVTPPGSNLLLSPNWPCVAAAPGFNCTSPAAVAIPPGGAVLLKATIQIPPLLTQPTCLVTNNVSIAAPLGAPQNIVPGDDTATATQSTALIAVLNPNGTVSVACDPTNLKTTKAVTSCSDAGSSLKCSYSITVTNTGPDPYQGPININDTFSAAPSSVSFPAGWTCNAAGTGFLCTKPGVKLSPPGKPGTNAITLEVTATVPKSGQCVLKNTATMSFPPSGTPFNLRGDDDSDTVSSPVPSPECEKKPTCEQPGEGEFRSVSGACVCKEGLTRSRKGTCVGTAEPTPPAPTANTCPDGKPIPRNGVCPCEGGSRWNDETKTCDAPCDPGPNEYRTSAGQCVCKTGFARRDGRCVTGDNGNEPERCTPGPNEVRNARDQCVCKDGYERDDGRCVPADKGCTPGPYEHRTSSGRCVCDDGYDRDDGHCVKTKEPERCTPGPHEYRTRKDGICLCEDGYDRVGGQCVKQPERCDPGPHGSRTRSGRCVCDDGYDRVDGQCIKINRTPKCDAQQYLSANGTCECKPGMLRIDGDCVEPEKRCPEGYDGKYPNCTKPEVKRCPEGYEGKYPNCKMIPPKACPEGTHGTYPDCKKNEVKSCPEGTTGDWPNCKRKQKEEPKYCPEGTHGTYPNCKKDEPKQCPEGTTGNYPNCKKIVIEKQCPNGMTGTPPNCKPKVIDVPAKKLNAIPNKPIDKKPIKKLEGGGKAPNLKDLLQKKNQNKPGCPKGQYFIGGKCVTPS